MSLTLKDAYEDYKDDGSLSYSQFREICHRFNLLAVEALLEGKRINLKYRLGYLQIIRIEQSFKNPRINWPESLKLKKQLEEEGKQLYDKETGEGHKWFVYFNNDYYFRYYWSKKHCIVRNKSVYKFIPTRGKRGAKTKLVKLLKEDELAEINFMDSKYV